MSGETPAENVIAFVRKTRPGKTRSGPRVTECSFCREPLVAGKHVQATDTDPAICFECVESCNELLKET